MDWYSGHSWAAGIQINPEGKDQESSSEAVNAYYAIACLGSVLGDAELEAWGRLLTGMEILGAQTYWQLMPNDPNPIQAKPFSDNGVVAIVSIGVVSWLAWCDMSEWCGHGSVTMAV